MRRQQISNFFLPLLFLSAVLSVSEVAYATEIHIDKDGKAVIDGAKVMQTAGGTFFTRLYWGESYVRLTVKTNNKTQFSNYFGEKVIPSDVAEGHLLKITGTVEGGTALSIVTSSLVDTSIQKERNEFSGKVISVDPLKNTFALETKLKGVVAVTSSTTPLLLKKGNRVVPISSLHAGEIVSNAHGSYNYTTKTLSADFAEISLDLSQFLPRNFEGKFKRVPGANDQKFILIVDGKEYTVLLSADTQILNRARNSTTLGRFLDDDTVRLFGRLREGEEPLIENIEIVRNTNL